MRRAGLLLLLCCGCASGPNTPDTVTAQRPVIYQGDADGATVFGDAPVSSSSEIAAPPATVWIAVKKVYSDLEIPVTLENAPGHQLGNPDFYKSRQMGGESMTQFVNCGSGMTGPNAATFRIYISSVTTVTSDGKGGTHLQTIFVPSGQDMSGSASNRLTCASTGRFEGMLMKRVAAVLGK